MIKKRMNVNRKTIYTYVLFLSIMISKFNINVGFSLKPYMVVTFIGLLLFIRDIKLNEIKLFGFEKLFMIFYIVYSTSIIFSSDKSLSIRYIILIAINIMFYLTNRFILYNENIDYQKIIINVLFVVVVLSLATYLIGILKLNFDYTKGRVITYGVLTDRSIARLIGVISHDPNIAMFYLTIPFFTLIFNLKNKKNIFVFVLSVLTILLTYSRGGLVGYFTALFILLAFNVKEIFKSKTFIIVVSIIVLFIILSISMEKGVIFRLYKRFLQSISTGGSGRLGMWVIGVEELMKQPLIGVGINNSRLIVAEVLDRTPKLLHNTFLEIMLEMGILLGISYVTYLAAMIKQFWLNIESKPYKILGASFIAMLVQSMFLSLPVNEFWFFLILCTVLVSKEKENIYDIQDKK